MSLQQKHAHFAPSAAHQQRRRRCCITRQFKELPANSIIASSFVSHHHRRLHHHCHYRLSAEGPSSSQKNDGMPWGPRAHVRANVDYSCSAVAQHAEMQHPGLKRVAAAVPSSPAEARSTGGAPQGASEEAASPGQPEPLVANEAERGGCAGRAAGCCAFHAAAAKGPGRELGKDDAPEG